MIRKVVYLAGLVSDYQIGYAHEQRFSPASEVNDPTSMSADVGPSLSFDSR